MAAMGTDGGPDPWGPQPMHALHSYVFGATRKHVLCWVTRCNRHARQSDSRLLSRAKNACVNVVLGGWGDSCCGVSHC